MSSARSMIEVRHGLADSDPGDPGDDVVEAFDVLDVERRIDVDPGGEQLLDIHVALGMPALRRIGMRKLIDQNEAAAVAPRSASRSISVEACGPCRRHSGAG